MGIDFHQEAAEYGLQLSPQQWELLDLYLQELEVWNKKMNLIGIRSRGTRSRGTLSHEMRSHGMRSRGIRSRERIFNELVLDSLIAASVLPRRARMLDVGSGAGFPGIPIKIYRPQIDIYLLDANLKKTHFLKHIIRRLRLIKIIATHGRIENVKDELHPRGYHIISARALTSLPQVFKWCSSYLLPNGLLVTFLGSQAERELQQHEGDMKRWSFIPDQIIPYFLPEKETKRSVVIFQKKA